MVTITAKTGDITTVDAEAVVVNLFEGIKTPGGGTGALDKALDGAISALIEDGEISGKQGEIGMLHTMGKLTAKRVIVVGLGKRDKFTMDTVRDVSSVVARHLRQQLP